MVIKLLKFHKKNYAVSTVISVLLVIGLVVSSMAIIIFWAMPLLEEKAMKNEMQSIIYSFEMVDNNIENMLIEGSGAKRIVGLICPNDKGSLSMSSYTDKFIVMYSYDTTYGFYTTELNDEDNYFNIITTGTGFNRADIYFLDPENELTPYANSYGFVHPKSYIREVTVNPSTNPINAGNDLIGNLMINLFDTSFSSNEPKGRIWVFDLGSITYQAYYGAGTQKTVYQNGAIFSTGFDDKGILNEPALITTSNAVALRIIQIKASSGFGGRGTPRLGLDLKNNIKREEPIAPSGDEQDSVYNLKFQIFGENRQSWLDYFTKIDGFDHFIPDSNTVYYVTTNPISFILDCSFIEINIG